MVQTAPTHGPKKKVGAGTQKKFSFHECTHTVHFPIPRGAHPAAAQTACPHHAARTQLGKRTTWDSPHHSAPRTSWSTPRTRMTTMRVVLIPPFQKLTRPRTLHVCPARCKPRGSQHIRINASMHPSLASHRKQRHAHMLTRTKLQTGNPPIRAPEQPDPFPWIRFLIL